MLTLHRPLEAPGLLVHLEALEAAVARAAGNAGVGAREPAHSAQLPGWQPGLRNLDILMGFKELI